MAELPELKIIVPPKPNQELVEPGAPTAEATPPVKKSKAGKIVAWTCGGCLGIILIGVLIIYAMISSYTNALTQGVPLTEQDKVNQPLAQAYDAAFKAQQVNLPHFYNWKTAVGSIGIPCSSNVDTCAIGDTGSTDQLEGTIGPSKLTLSDASMICDEVLAVAKTLGATQDSINDQSGYHPISKDANSRCVSMMKGSGRSVGFGWWTPSYFMLGETPEGTPFAIELNSYREPHGSGNISLDGGEYISYRIITSSVFDSPEPQTDPEWSVDLSSGAAQAGAFLDTLAYLRRANYSSEPNAKNPSPFSPDTAAWAKADFEKYFNVPAKFEYFKDSDGLVRWFHVKAKDGFEACVSTGTDKELVTQNEDTMSSPLESGLTGLKGIGKSIDGPKLPHTIGDYYRGTCHN